MKLVMIDWVDSSSVASGRVWSSIEDVTEEGTIASLLCRSVGWLVVDNKDSKTIIAHQAFGGRENKLNQVAGDMTIPSCAIVKMKVLLNK